MKKINISFHNMWGGFFQHDNIITNTLKLKYDVAVDHANPDIIVCQNTESVKAKNITDHYRGKSKVVHWYVEAFDRIGRPNYDDCDYSLTSCSLSHDKNKRLPLWSMYVDWFNNPYQQGRNQAYLISPAKLTSPKQKQNKNKFCSALTNNALGYRSIAYPEFIKFAVSRGLLVESRGNFCQTCPKLNGDEKDKLQFISDFKFHLTYDNSDVDGWITEKLLHPMSEGVIPIYWGGPDVENEFNVNGFIHVRRFNNLEEVHDRVFQIYKNEELFYDIQTQPCFPENKIPEHATPEYLLPFLEKIVEA